MITGIILAISACCIWGWIFVIPAFLPEFSALEVALGRHFMYGLTSTCIFLTQIRSKFPRYVWMKALHLSIISTVMYYTCIVLSSRYASAAICALLSGISPITVAFYGNWIQKETSFKVLLLPSLIIFLGLVIVNLPSLEVASSPTTHLLGVSFGLFALTSWSWFAVVNAKFLKAHPDIPPSHWCTLIGVATLFWVTLASFCLSPFLEAPWHKETPIFINFILGCSLLGIVCSWVGALLWNKACLKLPISVAGQLITFETLFGITFVYLITQTLPTPIEAFGMATLLWGVIYGVRKFAQATALG